MSKYGQASIQAIDYYENHPNISILEAWEIAIEEQYPDSISCQKKGCPRYAFLGLCEEGYVSGIPEGSYLQKQNNVNKGYAIIAIDILKRNPKEEFTPNKLWLKVMKGKGKKHNQQMDVVLALKNKNLLCY